MGNGSGLPTPTTTARCATCGEELEIVSPVAEVYRVVGIKQDGALLAEFDSSYASDDKEATLVCPACRQVHKTPENGFDVVG